jgi:transcription initiation factor TFIID subunit TAF12
LAAEDVAEHHTPHVAYEPAEGSVGFANRLTQLVEHQQQQQQQQHQHQQQQQQQQQQHILSQVVRASDNKFVTLGDGSKVIDIISTWRCVSLDVWI